MRLKDISHEEELLILEEGLKSRFWEIYTLHRQQEAFTVMGAALSERVENRDWMAGKATGVKESLNYPAKRIQTLKTMINQEKAKI